LLATLVQGFFAIILLAIVNIFPRNIGLRINQKNEQKE
jgi:hypothetical protein